MLWCSSNGELKGSLSSHILKKETKTENHQKIIILHLYIFLFPPSAFFWITHFYSISILLSFVVFFSLFFSFLFFLSCTSRFLPGITVLPEALYFLSFSEDFWQKKILSLCFSENYFISMVEYYFPWVWYDTLVDFLSAL